MAQLGEDQVAQKLLGRAERALSPRDPMRARILAARGEVALAARELDLAGRLLEAAEASLGGDRLNRTFVRLLRVRLLVLLGRVEEAAGLVAFDVRAAPPRLRAQTELLRADIAARRLRVLEAEAATARARSAARRAELPPLSAQVERMAAVLRAPVARVVREGTTRFATLADVASLAREPVLVVDACRHELRRRERAVPLASRPVLFALAQALGEVAPHGQPRTVLVERAFGVRRTNDSLRARLRVEVGRLRRILAPLGLTIDATSDGFVVRGERVVVVLPPADGEASHVLALLRSGEAWSSTALSTASGLGTRAVQRALRELGDAGKVESHGAGPSHRWVARPPDGFATTLLLATRPTRAKPSS
ncbi:MAG TPA: helix-turn-helix domain-containing protein [Polyangiaceae bacterium]